MQNYTNDDLLTLEQACEWLHLADKETLSKKVAARELPGFRVGRSLLFHKPTVIAFLAQKAGVPLDVIKLSLGKPTAKQ